MQKIIYKCGRCGKIFDEGLVGNERRVINHQNSAHGGEGKILAKREDEDSWS